jgi:hypothetical protein
VEVVSVAWLCLPGAIPQDLELSAEDLIPAVVASSVKREYGVLLQSPVRIDLHVDGPVSLIWVDQYQAKRWREWKQTQLDGSL